MGASSSSDSFADNHSLFDDPDVSDSSAYTHIQPDLLYEDDSDDDDD